MRFEITRRRQPGEPGARHHHTRPAKFLSHHF